MRKMKKLSKEQKEKIIEALRRKGAIFPCPRCGNNGFSLIDGYIIQSVQPRLKGVVIGGPSIPCANVVCMQCGFLSQHALGSLGLLPGKEKDDKGK